MGLYNMSKPLRHLFTVLTSRMFWTTLAILFQLGLIIGVIAKFQKQSIYIEGFFLLLSAAMVIWILNSRRQPAYQLAWIIPILAFPVFGGLIYLLLGGGQTTRYARRKMQAISDNLIGLTNVGFEQSTALAKLKEEHRAYGNQASYIERYTLMPLVQHTRTIYFPSGEEMFEQLLLELKKAKRYIFMEYFIIDDGHMWDSILKVLIQKAQEGVDVRLIYDDIGTITRLSAKYPDELAKYGIRCKVFGPFHPVLSMRFNNRDHRKITVIDGDVAFTGGANLADEYINHLRRFGYWKDSAIMLYGDAAYEFALLFLSMWDYLTNERSEPNAFRSDALKPVPDDGYVQVVADTPLDQELVSETAFRNLIGSALDSIYILTPYLVISSEMSSAIANAAKRGVSVHMVTPGRSDGKWYVRSLGRAAYEELLEAGVHIYEYQPGFLHSKVALVDNEVAYVGTVNMDYRSLYLHFECGVFLYQSTTVEAVAMDIHDIIANDCLEITAAEMAKVSLIRRLVRSILKVFAPLM